MRTLFVYGMRAQDVNPGAHPENGLLEIEADPFDEYKNVLVYSRKLSREDCEHYDLDFLGKREAAQ